MADIKYKLKSSSLLLLKAFREAGSSFKRFEKAIKCLKYMNYVCPHCERWNNKKPILDKSGKCPECKRQY